MFSYFICLSFSPMDRNPKIRNDCIGSGVWVTRLLFSVVENSSSRSVAHSCGLFLWPILEAHSCGPLLSSIIVVVFVVQINRFEAGKVYKRIKGRSMILYDCKCFSHGARGFFGRGLSDVM